MDHLPTISGYAATLVIPWREFWSENTIGVDKLGIFWPKFGPHQRLEMTIFSSPSPDITRGQSGLQFEDGANERCYKKETSSLTLMLGLIRLSSRQEFLHTHNWRSLFCAEKSPPNENIEHGCQKCLDITPCQFISISTFGQHDLNKQRRFYPSLNFFGKTGFLRSKHLTWNSIRRI